MKHIITFSALSALLLTQCSTVDSIRNILPGGPSVTNQTQAADYYSEKLRAGNLNSIAVKVDGSVVTRNEVNFMLSPIQQQLAAQFPRRGSQYYSEYSKAKKQITDELIDRELILNEFHDLGADIPAREIDREINNRITNLYNGNRSLFLADLKKNNLSQAKYRSLVERTIAVGAMKAQQMSDHAPPTTAELRKEYSKFSDKIRDISKDKVAYKKIWIPTNTGEFGVTREDKLELAEDIVAKLKKGADFATLAKEHSSDAYANQGGQWPLTQRIDFPVHFAPVIFKAPIGKIVGPLEDDRGFNIIQVTQKVNGPSPPLSKVRKQLEQRVIAERSGERFDRWIKRMRQKADIVRY